MPKHEKGRGGECSGLLSVVAKDLSPDAHRVPEEPSSDVLIALCGHPKRACRQRMLHLVATLWGQLTQELSMKAG